MTRQGSTYSWSSWAIAALLPAAVFAWFWLTDDFTSPDGTPDNAVIRSLPGVAVIAVFASALIVIAFHCLGLLQLRLPRPSLLLALISTLLLSALAAAWLYHFATVTQASDPMPAAGLVATVVFGLAWASLLAGAMNQFFRMRNASHGEADR